jgi:hypothetical protein
VTIVDCGSDGVANVNVRYGTGVDDDFLVGRNSTTIGVGGRAALSNHYGTQQGSGAATLTVTTRPTTGMCDTSLTDYESGNVVAQRKSAGQVILNVIVRGS